MNTSAWHDFYKSRCPTRYLRYAERRYDTFISLVQAHIICQNDRVLEAGCGIGTITRALIERGVQARFAVLDNCPKMLGMARDNLPDTVRRHLDDLRFFVNHGENVDVIHSHGVLEHFDNGNIQQILLAQKLCRPRAIVHYVPGEKYDTPSFGDERLMSIAEWRRIAKPTMIVPFNDGFDYAMVWV